MIYAIQAVGTEFIKIGRANSVGKRLKELETGCPHELTIVAVANWPDGAEKAIHRLLAKFNARLEWFINTEETRQVIEWMLNPNGLELLQRALAKLVEPYSLRHIRSIRREQRKAKRLEENRTALGLSLACGRDAKSASAESQRRAQRQAWWRVHSQHCDGEAAQQQPIIPALAVDRS